MKNPKQEIPEKAPLTSRSKSKKKSTGTKSPKKVIKKVKKKNYLNPNTNQIGQMNPKVLSLKQIKQLINDIMNQKIKFDKKC